MVGTCKTLSIRTAVLLDGSPIMEAVDDEDDTINITNQFSVGFLISQLFHLANSLGTTQFYAASLRQHLR